MKLEVIARPIYVTAWILFYFSFALTLLLKFSFPYLTELRHDNNAIGSALFLIAIFIERLYWRTMYEKTQVHA